VKRGGLRLSNSTHLEARFKHVGAKPVSMNAPEQIMNRGIFSTLFMASCCVISAAHAGPCTDNIAKFELAVKQSAGRPFAGPMAPQSIGAQMDRQPTPGSIKRAQQRAQAKFAATLEHAKQLNAQGDRSGCTRALDDAEAMYDLQ
jgi:hypothetical protein